MPREITFACVPITSIDAIRELVSEFETQTGVKVNFVPVEWENYRSEMVSMALKRQPVDVCLTGTPVTSDLIGMNILRPFSLQEISSLGGEAAFLPSRWQSGMRPGKPEVWAIPWMVDARLLLYWKVDLAQAGINEAAAFTSISSLVKTIQTLHRQGHPQPWAGAHQRFGVLHAVSSFIWGMGGDLFTPDGREAAFHHPEALQGIYTFFDLAKLVNPQQRSFDSSESLRTHQCAIGIGAIYALRGHTSEEIGCVPMPGGSYLGGADLVIWNSTREERACLDLVRFLNNPGLQLDLGNRYGFLSPRLSDLTHINALLPTFGIELARTALTGRTYPCVPLIGLVEDRLSTLLFKLLQEVYAQPEQDVVSIVRPKIEALGNRINMTLHVS